MKHFAITSLLLIFCTFLVAQKYSSYTGFFGDGSAKLDNVGKGIAEVKDIIQDLEKESIRRASIFNVPQPSKTSENFVIRVNPRKQSELVETLELARVDNKAYVEGFSIYDTHKKLSDGSFIPKYEVYYGNDFDHESLERNSKNTAKQINRGVKNLYRKTISTISKSISPSGRH